MAKISVICDVCSCVMDNDNRYWKVGREQDLCKDHYILACIEDLERKKIGKQEHVDIFLKEIEDVDKQIDKLKKGEV